MPPDEEENKPVIIKVENIPSAFKAIGAAAAELKALQKITELTNTSLKQGFLQSLGLINQVNEAQRKALKELGEINFDAKIERAFTLFKKLNNETNRYGVALKNTVDAQRAAEAAFIGSGRNVDALTRSLAANSRVVETSKILPFQKDLAFNVGLASDKIAESTNRMLGLDVAMRRPIGTMLGGVSRLSRGMATFGTDINRLRKMAQTIELTEAQIGTRGFLEQALQRTFTREGRVRTFARLQQISSQLRRATGRGLEIDPRIRDAADPSQRLPALVSLARSLTEIGPTIPGNLRRALAAALGPGTQFGQEATQRLLVNRLDPGLIQRGLAAQPVDIGQIRRGAVTAVEQRQVLATRAALRQARAEIRQFGRVFPRLGRAVSPDATVTGLANQAELFAATVAPLIAQRLGGVAGSAIGVGTQALGLGAGALGVPNAATAGNLATELSQLNRNISSLINLLRLRL